MIGPTRFEDGGRDGEAAPPATPPASKGAMTFVASRDGPKVPTDTKVTTSVDIGPRSEDGFGIDAGLEISLPGMPKPEAEALVAKAHQVCPYSNAKRNDLPVRLTVV